MSYQINKIIVLMLLLEVMYSLDNKAFNKNPSYKFSLICPNQKLWLKCPSEEIFFN